MVDFGAVMGALGLTAGIISLVYTRIQVRAERTQAEEATRASILQSNTEMHDRSREIRRRALANPEVREEFLSFAISRLPSLSNLLKAEGGIERFLVYRDAMDAAQDAFFLRRRGVMTDEHWYVWTKVHMAIWSKYPGFQKTFRAAAEDGLVHPDFASFYEPIFHGKDFTDPFSENA